MNLEDEAIQYAKTNRTKIARELTDKNIYPPSASPETVFMAGSPGAGKTEFSKSVLALIAETYETIPIRIDSDELRPKIKGYTGSNSSEVQRAVSLIVERLYDNVLKNRQTAIIDGTFANYEKARDNIERSLRHHRKILILYIYQDPVVAWNFTVAREIVEGRNIPKEAFIRQFLGARETIMRIRKEFPDDVKIILVKKDFKTNAVESLQYLLANGPGLDELLPDKYTEETLMKLI